MKRVLGIALVLALVVAPRDAQAQRRGGRSGVAMTPYGPVTNPTSTPEWRQAGGNPIVYQAIMDQKAAIAREKLMQQQAQAMQRQQQAARKQQQAYDKWIKDQKANKEKGKPVDPAYQRMLDQQTQVKAAADARAARAAAKKTKKKSATAKS